MDISVLLEKEKTFIDIPQIKSFLGDANEQDAHVGKHLASIFKSRSESLIASMKEHLLQNNFELVKRSAHSLHGVSVTIGAHVMGSISRILETESGKKSKEKIQSLFQDLEQAKVKTLEELDALLIEKNPDKE